MGDAFEGFIKIAVLVVILVIVAGMGAMALNFIIMVVST